MRLFRPISWYTSRSLRTYVSHILMELGRLGFAISDIETRSRLRESVLSDLLEFLTNHPGQAFANLYNWRTLDQEQMRARLKEDHLAKPRIELSAHITKKDNL